VTLSEVPGRFSAVVGEIYSFVSGLLPCGTFVGWGGACSGRLGCTVIMNGPQSVYAVFDP
jgi:hypothetical protein